MATATADTVLDGLRDLGMAGGLRSLELPEVQVVGPWRTRRPTRKAMLAGSFYVYGQVTRLRPPVDWLQGRGEDRTWRYELQTLTWLKEALARHGAGRDTEMLAVARDAVLDWARAHLEGGGEQSEFAWYDMAVGLRAPYIGYVLRAGLAEEMLSDEEARLLRRAAERHGEELASREGYAARNNHGLFQDEGLYLLARQLPALPAAAAWRELALTRIEATLRATIDLEEGAHLEHSPAYQLAVVDLVARLADNVTELPELPGLLDRMRRTAAWQVTPADRMAQLGDTDDLPAPPWARDAASARRGLNALFDAGQAFVREGDSYLAVSAAHHGSAHKHADDAGFVLIEGGRVLLGDAGRWGYYEKEPDRLYARSAPAHNVLTVDGEDFDWRGAEPYGSGVEAAGESDGWYAILIRNPLLGAEGVDHRRTLLYRPAEALIVVDDVRAGEEHEYTRHFNLGPELEVRQDGAGSVAIAGEGTEATLASLADDVAISLARGSEDPRLGWAYPGDRKRTAIWNVTMRARARDATFVTALTLGRKPLDIGQIEVEADRVAIGILGEPAQEVHIGGPARSKSAR